MGAKLHPDGWSDERVSLLKRLWLEGVSCSQIAKQLGGVTRSAVIGKLSRLGLSGHAKTSDLVPPAIARATPAVPRRIRATGPSSPPPREEGCSPDPYARYRLGGPGREA